MDITLIKKYFLFLLLTLSFTTCTKRLAVPGEDPMQGFTMDISYLASDDLEGRETGTDGESKAAAHIKDRFKNLGLTALGDDKKEPYYQYFSKKISSNPHGTPLPDDPSITGRNVIGLHNNNAKNTIVIGAHYDHLGYGKEGSLYTGEPAIHNGADDNASGIAALLYLAEVLSKSDIKSCNFLFIAFSGEEKGLWGSNYFINHPTVDISTMNFMINMDMVGRLDKDRRLAISGIGTSPVWKELLEKTNKYKFKLKLTESGVGPSDHTSFYLNDVPVLHFFTGQHADYHKPSDDIALINFSGIRDVSHYIYALILEVSKIEKLAFTKTKDESSDAPKFTVTLGVIPDYLYDGKGMRIDGVREGKPAHKADLQKGDIVITMDNQDISDMMSYMKALSSFKAGQTVKITIIRNGKNIEKMVSF